MTSPGISSKPFSKACENNKRPILEKIAICFKSNKRILEIGSGTGQHAVYFAEHMDWLFWQTTDQLEYHHGIRLWCEDYEGNNVGLPLKLDVSNQQDWAKIEVSGSIENYDGIFTANTAHIMCWDQVCDTFEGASKLLTANNRFAVYGPFNRQERYTSESNARFDQFLRNQNTLMGIRNDDAVFELAENTGFELENDHDLPANNRLLVFRKR